jgi:hypothetical protein
MDRQSPRRITGVELSNCLFGIVQAWAKRERGDTEGAGQVMALLLGRMPPGTVEMLLSAIGAGALPVPSPDTMGEWMEIYRAAKRGELAVTFPDGGSPVLESGPAPPAVETEDEVRDRPANECSAPPPPPERPPPWKDDSGMDGRVMVMCDVRASGITGEVADSHLVGLERRPSGGVTVLWSDLPEQAMIFDDAAAAAEFCRNGPLEMFVVSFVPVSGDSQSLPSPRAETDAEFMARLDRMVADAEHRQGAGEACRQEPPRPPDPQPADPAKPDLSEPGALSESLRRMGLM